MPPRSLASANVFPPGIPGADRDWFDSHQRRVRVCIAAENVPALKHYITVAKRPALVGFESGERAGSSRTFLRHYGLFASANRAESTAMARALLDVAAPAAEPQKQPD